MRFKLLRLETPHLGTEDLVQRDFLTQAMFVFSNSENISSVEGGKQAIRQPIHTVDYCSQIRSQSFHCSSTAILLQTFAVQ